MSGFMTPEDSYRAMNRLAKWRTILAGRVWGTAPKTPQTKGRTDIFEKLLIMRAEMNAIASVLIMNGIMTQEEWTHYVGVECGILDEALAQEFPGMRSSDIGVEFYDPKLAAETMKGWPA